MATVSPHMVVSDPERAARWYADAMDDVDGVWQKAIGAGATVFHPLSDTFWGDRHGQFIDPFGHRWGIYKHLRDVPADEIAREAANFWIARPNAG